MEGTNPATSLAISKAITDVNASFSANTVGSTGAVEGGSASSSTTPSTLATRDVRLNVRAKTVDMAAIFKANQGLEGKDPWAAFSSRR